MATTHSDTLRQQSFNAPIFDMISHTGQTCARALLIYQQELVRFTTCRLESGAELGRVLAQSHDWFEASKAQQQWFATMVADYAKETQRLLQMTTELGLKAAHESGQEARGAAQAGAEAARKTAEEAQSAAQATESYLRGAAEAPVEAEEAQAAGERAGRRVRRGSE